MVYIPFEPIKLGHEYYKAKQEAKLGVTPTPEVTGVNAISHENHIEDIEENRAMDPVIAAFRRRQRRNQKEKGAKRDPQKKDIMAARIRGGLVQYMLKMGYSMEQSIREANRSLAQMTQDQRASGDAGSRQVYLNVPPASMSVQMMQHTANDDYLGTIRGIATTPKALVDINI